MTSQPNQGRAIKCIFFNDEMGSPAPFPGPYGRSAQLDVEFHGDHDEDWVRVFDENGTEVRRWNARLLLGIEWADAALLKEREERHG